MDKRDPDVWAEAVEHATEWLGGEEHDDVLLQEIAEQIYALLTGSS
jgi:hypothetical protein